jgi:biotin transporter BioY
VVHVLDRLGARRFLMACVVPFLPGDAIKITLVTLIAPRLRTFVDKQQG